LFLATDRAITTKIGNWQSENRQYLHTKPREQPLSRGLNLKLRTRPTPLQPSLLSYETNP
jgi:hypothetical protein